jgi:hypothetical protein
METQLDLSQFKVGDLIEIAQNAKSDEIKLAAQLAILNYHFDSMDGLAYLVTYGLTNQIASDAWDFIPKDNTISLDYFLNFACGAKTDQIATDAWYWAKLYPGITKQDFINLIENGQTEEIELEAWAKLKSHFLITVDDLVGVARKSLNEKIAVEAWNLAKAHPLLTIKMLLILNFNGILGINLEGIQESILTHPNVSILNLVQIASYSKVTKTGLKAWDLAKNHPMIEVVHLIRLSKYSQNEKIKSAAKKMLNTSYCQSFFSLVKHHTD